MARDGIRAQTPRYPAVRSCAEGERGRSERGTVARVTRLVVGLLAALLVAPASTLASTGWSPPVNVGRGNGLNSVSCSPSFCAAVGANGYAVTFNGRSWGTATQIDSSYTFGLSSVSCRSAGFCAAIDDAGNGQTFSGSSWTTPAQVSSSSLDSVSCASPSFCVAVNGDSYTFNGTSWSAATTIGNGESFDGVSCPSSSFCAAVGHNGSGAVFDGSSWSTPASIDPNGQSLSSVSCPSSSFCVAVDGAGNALTFNGSTWSAPASIDPNGQGLSSVSCPSSSFCVAVGGAGNALTFNGSTWSAPASIDPNGHGLSSVSCSSASFCVAVDAVGDEITYTGRAGPPASGPLSFFPSPLDFGSVQPGVFTATKMVKVKNTSSQTISLAKLSVGSVSPAGVQIVFSRPTQHGVHGACGKVLGAGETCKLYLQIKIKRATSGAFTANLLIGKPASTLPLTGTIRRSRTH